MSNLPSQTLSSTTPSSNSDPLPILTGPANVAFFLKNVHEVLRSKYGEIGQNILNSTTTTLVAPGPCPHYNDPRLHPITAAPIPNSRKYEQVAMTNIEAADPNFDTNTLPLTEAGESKLNQDIKTWHSLTDRYLRLLDKHRTNDDELLTLLREHISPDALEVIKANPAYPAYLALPSDCIARSAAYLKIINSQFSHGNSTVSINELTKFLTLTQGPVTSDPTAAFSNRLSEHYDRVLPLLDHATTLAQLKSMLLCMVFIKGLNKSHPPTLRALEIHVQLYPGNASLDHYAELRTSVLAAQDSDIANLTPDVPSEHSSAFQASTSPPPCTTPPPVPLKGQQRPGRTDHCTYCLLNFQKYWYHKTAACNLKKGNITKLSTPPPSTVRQTLSARLAEIDAKISSALPSPPALPTTAGPFTTETQALSFLAHQGYNIQFEKEPSTI